MNYPRIFAELNVLIEDVDIYSFFDDHQNIFEVIKERVEMIRNEFPGVLFRVFFETEMFAHDEIVILVINNGYEEFVFKEKVLEHSHWFSKNINQLFFLDVSFGPLHQYHCEDWGDISESIVLKEAEYINFIEGCNKPAEITTEALKDIDFAIESGLV